MDGQTVTVRNDGRPFQPDDVDSLCDVGHSRKSPERYIGYLGVGFKSVFLISDDVRIHSEPYHFGFWRDEGQRDFPWQVAPRRIEPESVSPPWNTEFRLRVRNEQLAHKLGQEMAQESLNSRILLFLESLERLHLEDRNNGVRRAVVRIPLGNGLYEVRESNSEGTFVEKWAVFTSGPLAVPDDVRNDVFTINWNRDAAQHRAVSLAFKLTGDGELEQVPGTLHMGVFSYLPVREERSRLKFLVQADFLTSVGRTRVQEEAPWNIWLAGEVLNLIEKQASVMLEHPQWRRNALEVLWPQNPDVSDFFAVYVENPLRQYLREEVKLPAYDGTWVTPAHGLLVEDADMWELVGPNVLEQVYARKPLAKGVQVPFVYPGPELVRRAPSLFGNSNNPGFVSNPEGQEYVTERAAKGDVAFFGLLYERITAIGWTPRTSGDCAY